MGQQTLTAQIVLSGRVDSSFGPVSAALDRVANRALAVASGINQVSQPLLRTGKEVTQLYAGFDDAMKYIQAVSDLTESQLNAVEKAARNAGKTTRYSATSAAEALGFGAEAGLDYAENIGLLPDVLNMAAAGNMELEKSMDQLLTIIYSTGTPLSNAGDLVDSLAMAASSSKTDIESMGEAVARLGGISRYAKGGTSELLAMLAMLAQRGQEGSEAGTYLRNVMLALVAPTKKAAEVMEELELSEEDMDEALEGLSLKDAQAEMDRIGLSAFNASGELRPMIDILSDLKAITDQMTEEQQKKTLRNLFPSRTIAAVENLMGELETSYDRIAAAIDNATGAAKRMADTRESGIGGAIRRLTNAADELKLAFGEELAGKFDTWAVSLREFTLALSEMPEDKKNFLIDVGSAIAFMGPAAMFAGMTLKGLSGILAFISSPFGAVVAGGIALGVIATNLHNMAQKDRYNAIKRYFGELGVNAEALAGAVGSLDGGMSTALANLEQYGQASEDAGTKYSTLLQTLSGDINSAVIFDQTIEEANKRKLMAIADSMVSTVKDGIRTKAIQMSEFAELLIKDPGDLAMSKETLGTYFDGLTRGAYEIGAELRSKMTEALRDGKISAEEWDGIKTTAQRLNEIEAQIMNIQNSAESYALLEKGMRLGYGAFGDTSDAFIEQQGKIRDQTTALYDEYIGYIIAAEEAADREGKGQYTDKELDDYVARRRKDLDAVLTDNLNANSEAAMRLVVSMMNDNFGEIADYSVLYNQEVDRLMRENPGMTLLDARGKAHSSDALPEIDEDQWLAYNAYMSKVFELANSLEVETARKSYIDRGMKLPEWITQWDMLYDYFMGTQGDADWRGGTYGNRLVGDVDSNALYAQWLYENNLAQNAAGMAGYSIGVGKYGDMYSIPVAVELTPGETPPSSLLSDAFGEELSSQAAALGANDGLIYSSSFFRNIKSLQIGGGGAVGGWGPSDPTVMPMFAEGGRASEPSIFGEAGAEWAIPEAHTTRTAELLNSARAASGFTWDELIGANGGLGGGATYQSSTKVVFAPVIHAKDARGVKEVLDEEYEKFKRYYEDFEAEKKRREW